MAKIRRRYDKDFKRKIVELSLGEKTLKELSETYDIHTNQISRWRQEFLQLGELSYPGHGKAPLTEEEREIKALRKQLKDLEMEHAILKKAISIFSRNDGKSTGL